MIADYLIMRAKRTPYFHLEGYMKRWWLVPYDRVIERRRATVTPIVINGQVVGEAATVETGTDGTGPVSWRRPIAKLIQKTGTAVRVHEILRSDEADPHDHPWPYVTIILSGGYWETRYNAAGEQISRQWHGPGSVLYRPAGSWHRLDLVKGALPATTLFITGKYVGTWGFNVNGKKVPHYEYENHQ